MIQQNDNFYLAEAFNRLSLLNEDAFDLSADKGVVDELQSFVADDIEAPYEEEVIDVAAEDEDEVQDNYIGKVILQCDCCHAKIYKDPNEVILDETGELANIDDICPVCNCEQGWKVIGKIEPYVEPAEEDKVDEVEDDIGEGGEEVEAEFSDDEISEALREALNPDEQNKLDQIVNKHLTDAAYEAEVGHELDVHRKDMEKAEAAFNDDFYFGDVDESCKNEECKDCEEECDKDLEEKCDESLNEEVEPAIDEQEASEDAVKLEDSEQEPIKEELGAKAAEDAEKLVDPKENPVLEALSPKEFDKFLHKKDSKKDSDKLGDAFYKELKRLGKDDNGFGSYLDMYKALDKQGKEEISKLAKTLDESLNEDVRNISVDVDGENHIEIEPKEDGGVEIEVNPSEEAPIEGEGEMIAPLDDQDIEAIEGNNGELPEEEPVEDEFEIDDFDEESFDELGESFLKRVYDNVGSFNTTKVTQDKGKLVVEGLIKFNSGKEKATSFVFEDYKNTKRGKTMISGMNETFSKSNRTFLLKGTLENKKYTCESLTYNYNVQQLNESNESETVHIYGRAIKR